MTKSTGCKVLLTGFDAFGGRALNISAVVVNRIARETISGVVTEVLRTSYSDTEERVEELIAALRPSAILLTGESQRPALNIELKARNADSQVSRDNDNVVGRCPIIADGPTEYASTLPVDAMNAELGKLGLSCEYSVNAGDYVCNHAFYMARHFIEKSGLTTVCGFMHLPCGRVLDDKPTEHAEWVYEGVRAVTQLLVDYVK
jgi:pyroglutamyl-peptidase